jgi:predicted Zn-dependent protease
MTLEEKKNLIAAKLGISEPDRIKILERSDINGEAIGSEIRITRGALEKLSEEEIAFVLAHEKTHIDARHTKQDVDFVKDVCSTLDEIAKDKNTGFFSKVLQLAGTVALGTAAVAAKSHLNEYEADLAAKNMLKKAGYTGKGGEELMNRFERAGQGASFTHPNPKWRKKIL